MGFELYTPRLPDAHELCGIEVRVAKSWNIFQLMMPIDEEQVMEDWLVEREERWYATPDQKAVAVRDTGAGKAVAWTRWEVPSPHNADFTDRAPPKGANVELRTKFRRLMNEMGERQPKAANEWSLLHVHTEAAYQYNGCGTLMIRHITNLADEAGAPMHVMATNEGKPLYSKCGFRETDELVMDLSEYGGEKDATVLTYMVRPAKTP